jgi:hypothetical protein
VNRATRFDSRTAQITFVVIDQEILSTVIRTVPLTSARACTAVISSLQLVLVKSLTACPRTMRWLNNALVNSMRHTAVIRTIYYHHHHNHQVKFLTICTRIRLNYSNQASLKLHERFEIKQTNRRPDSLKLVYHTYNCRLARG